MIHNNIRHNEFRDTIAELMRDLCFAVEVEPNLQSLQGKPFEHITTTIENGARLDIQPRCLRDSRFSTTFSDVKVFNSFAKNCSKSIQNSTFSVRTRKNLNENLKLLTLRTQAPTT